LKPHEAQQRVGEACKLRMDLLNMKTKSLHRLQEPINEIKGIDDKILDVDIHIGRLYHVVENSMARMPSRKERTIIVEWGLYCHCYYYFFF
jgi:hypothetical protein